jgi:starch synthase
MLSTTGSADTGYGERRAPLCVLLVASEIYPLAKTGGLADVCGALPKALREAGVDVRLLMPAYPSAIANVAGLRRVGELAGVGASASLLAGTLPGTELPIWLLDCAHLYQRPGTPYQDVNGSEWPDNALRYGALCRAAVEIACGRAAPWRADVVHCNDWHTGLIPLLLRSEGAMRPRSVFTIHNAAFQGNVALSAAQMLGLDADASTLAGIEYYGQMSFLKSGTVFADKITTVSPTYARELRTPEYGCGMHGVFESRAADLLGILNGIDTEVWNPARDEHLARRYSSGDRNGKRECKAALQASLGLRVDENAPLAISASRLTTQKMADVLLRELPDLMRGHPDMQFALLGCGDRGLESGFEQFARGHPGRVAVEIGYREAAAHRLHAGADILLHGARFEPCGLAQLYAMQYGTIPVVRRVGGLADSVFDVNSASSAANGFVFDDSTGAALRRAVDRCLAMYAGDRGSWNALIDRAMRADFSWRRSAKNYTALFCGLAGKGENETFRATDPGNDERLMAWNARCQRLRRSAPAETDRMRGAA